MNNNSKTFANIEDVRPGQTFKCLGVEYKMLRHAGTCQQPNRNQWGRATGGFYTAVRCAVKVNKHHKGWWFSYTAFYPNMRVEILD